MVQCLVIRCPLCGKENPVPAERASEDVFADRVASHLHMHHPELSPPGAEEAMWTALDSVRPAEIDQPPEEIGGWD